MFTDMVLPKVPSKTIQRAQQRGQHEARRQQEAATKKPYLLTLDQSILNTITEAKAAVGILPPRTAMVAPCHQQQLHQSRHQQQLQQSRHQQLQQPSRQQHQRAGRQAAAPTPRRLSHYRRLAPPPVIDRAQSVAVGSFQQHVSRSQPKLSHVAPPKPAVLSSCSLARGFGGDATGVRQNAVQRRPRQLRREIADRLLEERRRCESRKTVITISDEET